MRQNRITIFISLRRYPFKQNKTNKTFLSFLAVMEAIPTIVCDTLYTLGLHDQTPSWKIMDNKGRITVVLHWEPEDVAALRSSSLPAIAGPSRQSSTCSTIASGGPRLLGIHARSISQVNTLLYLISVGYEIMVQRCS